MILPQKTQYKDPIQAFESAIECQRLSRCPTAWNYFAHFQYCGTWEGIDQFRNCTGRLLIAPPELKKDAA